MLEGSRTPTGVPRLLRTNQLPRSTSPITPDASRRSSFTPMTPPGLPDNIDIWVVTQSTPKVATRVARTKVRVKSALEGAARQAAPVRAIARWVFRACAQDELVVVDGVATSAARAATALAVRSQFELADRTVSLRD